VIFTAFHGKQIYKIYVNELRNITLTGHHRELALRCGYLSDLVHRDTMAGYNEPFGRTAGRTGIDDTMADYGYLPGGLMRKYSFMAVLQLK